MDLTRRRGGEYVFPIEEEIRMAQLNAYLHFSGDCREAMNFYKACLGGELNLMVVGDSPMAAQMPPGAKNNIMHALLKSGSISIRSRMSPRVRRAAKTA